MTGFSAALFAQNATEVINKRELTILQESGRYYISNNAVSHRTFLKNVKIIIQLGENIRKYQLCKRDNFNCEDGWFIASFVFLATSMILQLTHAILVIYNVQMSDDQACSTNQKRQLKKWLTNTTIEYSISRCRSCRLSRFS